MWVTTWYRTIFINLFWTTNVTIGLWVHGILVLHLSKYLGAPHRHTIPMRVDCLNLNVYGWPGVARHFIKRSGFRCSLSSVKSPLPTYSVALLSLDLFKLIIVSVLVFILFCVPHVVWFEAVECAMCLSVDGGCGHVSYWDVVIQPHALIVARSIGNFWSESYTHPNCDEQLITSANKSSI